MTDASAAFSISLKDGTSGPARSAGASLTQLKSQLDKDTLALRSMQQAMGRLRPGSKSNAEAFRLLNAQIIGQKAAIAGAQAGIVGLGGHLASAGEQASTFGDRMSEGLDKARSPGEALKAIFHALPPQMQMVATGMLAIVGAAAALATAVTAAAVALGTLALASANAARTERLHLEGLTTLRSAYGVARGSASDLVASIDHVSESSALSRGELTSMAEGLYRAGLRGANLQDALDGLSIAQSVQGDRGAARFRALAVGMRGTAGGVRRLADDYRQRLGGTAARMAMGLERLSERLHESVDRIFRDVRIEGFLSGLQSVVHLFSQTSVTGRALHQIAGAIFSPLFDSVGRGAPTVTHFFHVAVQLLLRATTAVVRFETRVRSMQHAFESAQGLTALHDLSSTLTEIEGTTHVAEAAFGSFATTLRNLFPTVALFVDSIRTAFAALDAPGAGAGIGRGLAVGIRSSTSAVRSAAHALGAAAETGTREALEIHSPSRVFAGLGRQVSRGLAAGVDAGDSDVTGATERVAASATSSASSAIGGTRGSAMAGPVNVSVAIQIQGSGESAGREAARAFADELAHVLEGAAIEMGALP